MKLRSIALLGLAAAAMIWTSAAIAGEPIVVQNAVLTRNFGGIEPQFKTADLNAQNFATIQETHFHHRAYWGGYAYRPYSYGAYYRPYYGGYYQPYYYGAYYRPYYAPYYPSYPYYSYRPYIGYGYGYYPAWGGAYYW